MYDAGGHGPFRGLEAPFALTLRIGELWWGRQTTGPTTSLGSDKIFSG